MALDERSLVRFLCNDIGTAQRDKGLIVANDCIPSHTAHETTLFDLTRVSDAITEVNRDRELNRGYGRTLWNIVNACISTQCTREWCLDILASTWRRVWSLQSGRRATWPSASSLMSAKNACLTGVSLEPRTLFYSDSEFAQC